MLTQQVRQGASRTAFGGTMTLLGAAKTQPTPEKLSLDPHMAMRTLCYTSKPVHTVQHTNQVHCVQHSKRLGKTPKPAQQRTQNCAITVQRTDSEVCNAYLFDFGGLNGAQSRNRTSDTRIFNAF